MNAELAQQCAWRAYFTTLKDHPSSTPEQRARAEEMLAKKPIYQRALDAERAETCTAEDLV